MVMSMDIEVTRMSAKGQVVIPKEMRQNIKEGEKLVVIRSGKQIILERVRDLDKNFEEEMEFARRTEEAWKDFEGGRYKKYPVHEFLKKLRG